MFSKSSLLLIRYTSAYVYNYWRSQRLRLPAWHKKYVGAHAPLLPLTSQAADKRDVKENDKKSDKEMKYLASRFNKNKDCIRNANMLLSMSCLCLCLYVFRLACGVCSVSAYLTHSALRTPYLNNVTH